MSLLGPAIGYVLGGQLLNIYIDIQMPKRQDMTSFIASYFLILIFFIKILGFSPCKEKSFQKTLYFRELH